MCYHEKTDPKLKEYFEACKCEHKGISHMAWNHTEKKFYVSECGTMYDCCDCGGENCGCAYCFSCHACESCLSEE